MSPTPSLAIRLIRTDALRRVTLSSRGYEIETEMLIKLARRGARIARVPVGLHYHGVAEQIAAASRHDAGPAFWPFGIDSSRSDSNDGPARPPDRRDGTHAA